MQVLPVEGAFGGTVLITCVLAVGTIAVHVWSDVKTTHLWICRVFVHPVIKNNEIKSPYFERIYVYLEHCGD